MTLRDLPIKTLKHKPLRTTALMLLTFFLSFVIFSGSLVIMSLQNGLGKLEDRLGADIVVVPNSAKTKIDPKTMLLNGTPGYFYMDKEKMSLIQHIEGVDTVSPQIFLASLSASCCSVPVQIIGFDPDTDFLIQPWIRESYNQELGHGDVVVGSSVNADCRIVAKLENTGTSLDTAVYTKADTIRTLIDSSQQMGLNTMFTGDVNDIISSVYIKVKDGYDIKKVTDNINLRVRKVKAIQMKEMFSEIGSSLSGISQTVSVLIIAIWIMAFIILTISFSILVGERKREFALLRMMGLSRKRLAGLLLQESFLLSLAGGITGTGMGLLLIIPFGKLIETSLHLPFLIPTIGEIGLIVLGTLVMISIAGPLASGYAAYRLSHVDPATILREGN